MTRALILIPPFLKYVAGPLLGPAMLAGAGRGAGHDVQVCDLNALYLRERLPASGVDGSTIAILVGDATGDAFGRAVGLAGDVDADGALDWVIGAPDAGSSSAFSPTGAVHMRKASHSR